MLGKCFDGLVPLLVAEPGLDFELVQIHGGVGFQQVQDQFFIVGELNSFLLGFHLRET